MPANDRITLTPEQHAKVIEALRVLDRLHPQLQDLEACGENCELRRNQVINLQRQLTEMDNRFRPQ